MKQTKTQSNQPTKMHSLLILLLSIEECLLFWSDCKFDILFVSFSPAAIPAKDEPWSPSSDLETHRRAAASCQSKRATEQMAPEYITFYVKQNTFRKNQKRAQISTVSCKANSCFSQKFGLNIHIENSYKICGLFDKSTQEGLKLFCYTE